MNFKYTLDHYPVFGPGAKTRVSMVSTTNLSSVYHFWRTINPVKEKRQVLLPELALEIFSKNFRFSELNPDSTKVIIKKMKLGYFAMSPGDVQNYLIPVYQISGTTSNMAMPVYDFDLYVVAIKYSEKDVEKMGLDIGGAKGMVF